MNQCVCILLSFQPWRFKVGFTTHPANVMRFHCSFNFLHSSSSILEVSNFYICTVIRTRCAKFAYCTLVWLIQARSWWGTGRKCQRHKNTVEHCRVNSNQPGVHISPVRRPAGPALEAPTQRGRETQAYGHSHPTRAERVGLPHGRPCQAGRLSAGTARHCVCASEDARPFLGRTREWKKGGRGVEKPRTKSHKHRKELVLLFTQPFEQGIRGTTPVTSCEPILPWSANPVQQQHGVRVAFSTRWQQLIRGATETPLWPGMLVTHYGPALKTEWPAR